MRSGSNLNKRTSENKAVKCLDSDFLVAILRANSDAESKMESLDAEGDNATTTTEGDNATTTINAFELFYGAHKSTKKCRAL
jgi:predicted nucleic acid-binding protein